MANPIMILLIPLMLALYPLHLLMIPIYKIGSFLSNWLGI